jgi:hypothetical protein
MHIDLICTIGTHTSLRNLQVLLRPLPRILQHVNKRGFLRFILHGKLADTATHHCGKQERCQLGWGRLHSFGIWSGTAIHCQGVRHDGCFCRGLLQFLCQYFCNTYREYYPTIISSRCIYIYIYMYLLYYT